MLVVTQIVVVKIAVVKTVIVNENSKDMERRTRNNE